MWQKQRFLFYNLTLLPEYTGRVYAHPPLQLVESCDYMLANEITHGTPGPQQLRVGKLLDF